MQKKFMKKTKKWVGFDFDSQQTFEKPPREGTDESDEAKQFFRDFRSDLKAMLKNTGFKIYNMKPNYYDIHVVLSNNEETKFCMVFCGDLRYGNWTDIVVRGMANAKDYSGFNYGNHRGYIDDMLFECIEKLLS